MHCHPHGSMYCCPYDVVHVPPPPQAFCSLAAAFPSARYRAGIARRGACLLLPPAAQHSAHSSCGGAGCTCGASGSGCGEEGSGACGGCQCGGAQACDGAGEDALAVGEDMVRAPVALRSHACVRVCVCTCALRACAGVCICTCCTQVRARHVLPPRWTGTPCAAHRPRRCRRPSSAGASSSCCLAGEVVSV